MLNLLGQTMKQYFEVVLACSVEGNIRSSQSQKLVSLLSPFIQNTSPIHLSEADSIASLNCVDTRSHTLPSLYSIIIIFLIVLILWKDKWLFKAIITRTIMRFITCDKNTICNIAKRELNRLLCTFVWFLLWYVVM